MPLSNMISSFAPGLAVRVLLSVAGNISPKAGWALIGLWDGYAVRQMTERTISYEAPVIWGLLFLVDYYISNTASLYKTSIISLWTVLGIIVTDLLSPQHWYDTTSERRKARSKRHASTPTPAHILPSQPFQTRSRQRTDDMTGNQRPIIEEQTAVTFAARSGTSYSSDISSLAGSGSETWRPNAWDGVPVSSQPNTSDGTGHRVTRHPSTSATPASGHSSDPYDTQLPSPPNTFSQRTPYITDIVGSPLPPGAFAPRRGSGSPTSRNSTPPLMVPSVHLDPSLSQGTLLSSDSEPSIPPDLLSPLDIGESGTTPQSEAYKIVPPRRTTPMPPLHEVQEQVVGSPHQVGANGDGDDARLTSSEEDSSSEVGDDQERVVRAANMYRKRAKDHENEAQRFKKDLKLAGKKQSIVLRNRLEVCEEQAIKYHAKADELFFRADNANLPRTIDFHRVMSSKLALRELKKHLARFLASNEVGTTIRLGKVRNHDVRQAILTYLSDESIPFTSQDPTVIIVAQLTD